MAFLQFVLLALATATRCAALMEFPFFVTQCYEGDEDRDACFLKNAVDVAQVLNGGYAPLNLTSLNPLKIKDFVVSQKSSGLYLAADDVNIFNAHNYTTKNAKINKWGEDMQADILFPRLYINGTYKVDGSITLLQLQGTGPLELIVDKFNTKWYVKLRTYKNAEGEEMITIRDFTIKTSFTKATIRLENLFNGDKFLTNTVNEALNTNMDVISPELMPLLEKRLAAEYKKITNGFLKFFTRKQMFPKIGEY